MKVLLIFVLLCTPLVFLAQQDSANVPTKPLFLTKETALKYLKATNVSALAGVSSAFATGKSIHEMKADMKSRSGSADSVNGYRGYFAPRTRFHVGLGSYTPLQKGWGISTSWFYAQRGFFMKEKISYHDPLYKYDEIINNRMGQVIHTLTFSIAADYKMSPHFSLYLGCGLSNNIAKRNNRMKQILEKEVQVNGSIDAEKSIAQTKSYTVPSFNKTTVSLIGGIKVPVKPKCELNLFTQYTNRLVKQNPYQNLLVNMGIIYQL